MQTRENQAGKRWPRDYSLANRCPAAPQMLLICDSLSELQRTNHSGADSTGPLTGNGEDSLQALYSKKVPDVSEKACR